MNVIHLVEDLEMGGMERVVHRLALSQKRSGWTVGVIGIRSGGIVADMMEHDGLSVARMNLGAYSGWSALGPLARSLRAKRPFILHAHGAARAVGRLAGRLAGAKAVVHHLHGTERYGWKQKAFERLFKADAYLACSRAVGIDFEGQTGLRTEVLLNPVDTEEFCSTPNLRSQGRKLLGTPDDKLVVLMMGRFVPSKAHGIVIDAIPRVRSAYPNALFVFLGDGPLRNEMESRASRWESAVLFLGRRSDPIPYLNACDVYIQPSVGREGMPLSVLETMACGRPVIASRLEGLPEAIGDAGVLVPPGDAGALSQAICDLLGNPKRRRELGERARGKMLKEFSLTVISRNLESIYRRLGAP